MKQRILAFLLAFALMLAYMPLVFADEAIGGTEDNPIVIYSWADFEAFLNSASGGNTAYYSLGGDIVFDGNSPVGGYSAKNTALDGNGYTVSGIQVKTALFSAMENSAFRNITFSGISVTASDADSRMAVLAETADFYSYITSCTFTDCTLNLPNACMAMTAGVIVAENEGIITNCTVNGDCTFNHSNSSCADGAAHFLGGIVGKNSYGLVVNSVSAVRFSLCQGKNYTVGGITAINELIVEYCLSKVSAPADTASFGEIAGKAVGDSEITDCLYMDNGKYVSVGGSLKDYGNISIEELAAEMTETVQRNYNQNYDFSMYDEKDLACPWTVENGELALCTDGMTAWVYLYTDTTLQGAEISFQKGMGKKTVPLSGGGSKYAMKVGSYINGEYVRNSFEVSYNTDRYMMVNNYVYRPNQSYIKKIQNTADGLEQNYIDMYLAPVSEVVPNPNGGEAYVVNTADGKVYPFCTTLSLTNLKVKDELVALRFDGEGTQQSPFRIKNGYDMQTLSFYVASGTQWNGLYFNEAHYIVVNDIDLTGFSFSPIGANGQGNKYAFRGVFDGQGYTLSNYTLSTTQTMQGLFGLVAGYSPENGNKKAVIKNVLLRNIAILNSGSVNYGDLRGALVGQAEYATISGCAVDNENTYVEGGTQIGGLIGYAYYCDIVNCGVSSAVHTYSGMAYGGGIVGNVAHSVVENCYINTNFTVNNATDGRFIGIGPVSGYIRDTKLINNYYTNHAAINYGIDIPGVTLVTLDKLQSKDFAADLTVYSEQNGLGTVWLVRTDGSKLPVPMDASSTKAKYVAECVTTDIGTVFISGGVSMDTYPVGKRVEVTKNSGVAELKGIILTDMNGNIKTLPVTTDSEGQKYSFSMPFYSVRIIPLFDTEYLQGVGSETDPYRIYTYEDLIYMADKVNNSAKNYKGESYREAYYSLMADIDGNGQVFSGIGKSNATFKGYFYGNGHTISNTVFETAMFVYVASDVLIDSLELKNITVKGDYGALFVYNSAKYTYLRLYNVAAIDCAFSGQNGKGFVSVAYGDTEIYNFLMKNVTYSGGTTSAFIGTTYQPAYVLYGFVVDVGNISAVNGISSYGSMTVTYMHTYKTSFSSNGGYASFINCIDVSESQLCDKGFLGDLTEKVERKAGLYGWCPSSEDGSACISVFDDNPIVYSINYENVLTDGALSIVDMTSAPNGASAGDSVVLQYNTDMYTGNLSITDKNGKTVWHTYEAPTDGSNMGKINFIMPESTVYVKNNGKAVQYAGLSGAGTADTPYIITTPTQLKLVADLINGTVNSAQYYYTTDYNKAHFLLAADLDMDGIDWPGIGTNGQHFLGCFDGGNHTIANLNINGGRADGSRQGLFMILGQGSTVKNLMVKNANIWSESTPVRGAAAIAKENNGTISCVMVVDSTIQLGNWSYLGGIAGNNTQYGVIEYCGVVNTLLCYCCDGVGNFSIGGLTANNSGKLLYSYTYGCELVNANSQTDPLCPNGNEPEFCYYYTDAVYSGKWSSKSAMKGDFTGGHVTYFNFNNYNTNAPVWRQNLDVGTVDGYPVPFSNHSVVYFYNISGHGYFTNVPMITMGVTLVVGDANQNGRVDDDDAVRLGQYLSGTGSLGRNGLISCDVNSDGKVDKNDLALLRDYLQNGTLSVNTLIGKIAELDNTLPDDGVLLGDVNRDGIVDRKDLELIRDYLDGKLDLDGIEQLAANVDLSDGFDASDLLAIQQYLNDLAAGKYSTGHIGKYTYLNANATPPAGDSGASLWIGIAVLSVAWALACIRKKKYIK